MSKKTKTYFPDSDDSDIVFNLPGDTSSASFPDDEKDEPTVVAQQEGSDSDEAPEDVSFSVSKQAAVNLLKAEEKGRRDVQEKRKEKQQKREALHKEQKEEKLKRLEILAAKRLPEELLDAISTSPAPNAAKPEYEKQKKVKKTHIKFDSEHYIPLATEEAPDRFKVAVLDSKNWKNTLSKPGQCPVQDFRHNALYNSKIKREPTTAIHQARLKLQVSGKDLTHQSVA